MKKKAAAPSSGELLREYETAVAVWSEAVRNFGRQQAASTSVQQRQLMKQVDEAAVKASLAKKALARDIREKEDK